MAYHVPEYIFVCLLLLLLFYLLIFLVAAVVADGGHRRSISAPYNAALSVSLAPPSVEQLLFARRQSSPSAPL